MSVNTDLQALLKQFVDDRPIGTPGQFVALAAAQGHTQADVIAWADDLKNAAAVLGIIDEGQSTAVLLARLESNLNRENAQKALKAIFRLIDLLPEHQDSERLAKIAVLTLWILELDTELDAARVLGVTLPVGSPERTVLQRGYDVTDSTKAAFVRKRKELQRGHE